MSQNVEETDSAANEIKDPEFRNNFFGWLCAFSKKLKDHWTGRHTLLSPSFTHFKNVSDDHFLVCLLLKRPLFDRELFIDLRKLVSIYNTKYKILSNMLLGFDLDNNAPCILVEIEKSPTIKIPQFHDAPISTSLEDIKSTLGAKCKDELLVFVQNTMKKFGSLQSPKPPLDASITENHNDTYTLKIWGYMELRMERLLSIYKEIGEGEFIKIGDPTSFFIHQIFIYWLKDCIEISICIKQATAVTEEPIQYSMSNKKRKIVDSNVTLAKKRFGL